MTSMQMLVDSKDFNRLAVNDDTMDPLCENDFSFTQTKVDYENHSPLHDDDTDPFNETGEGVETGDDGNDGNDVVDELLIVSEEEAIIGAELEEEEEEESGIRVVTHLHHHEEEEEEEEEEMLSARIDEDHSSEQEQEEGEDFDESHVYRELAKMEIAEKEECTVSLATEAEHSEEELGSCAGKEGEELDISGRPVRLYATPRNQLVYTIGKIQISHSQAKLFHLFDKNGEINVENIKNKSRESSDKNYDTESYKKTFSRVKALANHRCVDTTLVDEEVEKELTFQPARSKQAGGVLHFFYFYFLVSFLLAFHLIPSLNPLCLFSLCVLLHSFFLLLLFWSISLLLLAFFDCLFLSFLSRCISVFFSLIHFLDLSLIFYHFQPFFHISLN
jgi:hypothetical protein